MALRANITAEQHGELDEGLRSEYKANDTGGYDLVIDGTPPGFVSETDHEEVRRARRKVADRNDALLKSAAKIVGVDRVEDLTPLEQRLAKFEGIDPDEFHAMKRKLAGTDDDGKPKRNIDGVEDMLSAALEPLQTQIGDLQTKLESAESSAAKSQSKLHRTELERAMRPVISKASPRDGATETVLERVHESFEWDPEMRRAVARDGVENANGAPMTPEEWVLQQKRGALSFAFVESAGGGKKSGDEETTTGGKIIVRDPDARRIGELSRMEPDERRKYKIVNSADEA